MKENFFNCFLSYKISDVSFSLVDVIMNSHETPLFASSTNAYYDINYELSEQHVIPKLESLILPQDVDYQHLDDRESYAFLCDQWKNQISLNSENVLLPFQLNIKII